MFGKFLPLLVNDNLTLGIRGSLKHSSAIKSTFNFFMHMRHFNLLNRALLQRTLNTLTSINILGASAGVQKFMSNLEQKSMQQLYTISPHLESIFFLVKFSQEQFILQNNPLCHENFQLSRVLTSQ
ncbi:hypothetical protein L1049_004396 [Liquidambar formosana]|uniref:Uncharacterized protein n=1 Tax=Liquidambar formosana TaxID=63359 RepID=A0AAP0RNX4_LIQFO